MIAYNVRPPNGGSNVTTVPFSRTIELAVGDYVELRVVHDVGSALNINLAAGRSPMMTAVKIGAPNAGVDANNIGYPAHIQKFFAGHANVETTWPASPLGMNAGQPFGNYRTSTGAQNAELAWDVDVDSGTYTFQLLHVKGLDHGIYTLSVDGVTVGTIDGYNAAAALYAQYDDITGIVLTRGKRHISLKMATKNGASSSYYGQATLWTLTKTA
jgi:hypothetical protein